MKSLLNTDILRNKKGLIKIILIVFFTGYSNLFIFADENYWQIDSLDNPAAGYLMMDNPRPYLYMQKYVLADNYGNAPYFEELPPDSSTDYFYYFPFTDGTIGCLHGYNIFVYNDSMNIIDTIPYPPQYKKDFHAAIVLRNGHYILLCAERVSLDMSNIVENGDPNAEIINTLLVETDNTGEIYWIWNPMEHFAITDITDNFDLTAQSIDFTHPNAICEADDGSIYLSNRNLDEVTKINKETGEVIWRMGGSHCENNEFTFINDDIGDDFGFSHQHSIHILDNGNLLLFDNGDLRPDFYSRAVEYELDEEHKTATKVWEYRHSPDLQTAAMGSVQRLPNGNTLVNWSFGNITEVRPDGEVALEVILEDIPIYRAFKTQAKLDAVMKYIDRCGEFTFNDSNKNTEIKLTIASYENNANLSVEKHDYPPPTYSMADTTVSNILPYRWVIRKDSLGSMIGSLEIDLDDITNVPEPNKLSIHNRPEETRGDFELLDTYYDSFENSLIAEFQNIGEFIICSHILEQPILEMPADSLCSASLNTQFSWRKVRGAENYVFQLSENENFESILNEQNLNTNYCLINGLEKSHQYYWRVYAINSKDSSDWSEVFTFSTKLSEPVLRYPAHESIEISLDDQAEWSIVENAIGYQIQVSKNDNFVNNKINNYTSSNYYSLGSLDLSNKYYWHVRAYNTRDTSNWSSIFSFETEKIAPQLLSPYDLELDVPISGFLNWLDMPLAVSYTFEIAKDSTFESIVLTDTSITDNYYYYVDLEYSTKYYWRVRAVFPVDTSDWSEPWSFTTFDKDILLAPTLISPENGFESNDRDGILIWRSNIKVSYYELNVSKSIDFDSLVVEEFFLSDTSYAYSEFEVDTTYFWRVKAFSSVDSSDWSDVWSFNIKEKQKLGFVNLVHPFYNALQIPEESEFRWRSEEEAIKYQLQITDFYFNEDSLLVNEMLTDTVFLYSGLEKNEKYFWRVRYFTETDTSMWSFPWIFTTEPVVLLDTPDLIYPIDSIRVVPVDVEFKWKKIEGEEIYMLECSRYPYFFPWKYYFFDIEDDFLEYSQLRYNSKYYWRLMAYNDSCYSQWSDVEVFYTELQPPILIYPDSNTTEVKVNGSIVWDTVKGADWYVIEISKDETFENILISNRIYDKLSYNYSLEEDTKYYFRIKAQSEVNESQWTYDTLKTEKVTDIFEYLTSDEGIKIYPNPVKNELIAEIFYVKSQQVEIKIMSIIGELKYQRYFINEGEKSLLLRMNISHLSSGVYLLICEYNSEIFIKRLIVID
jgi:hypothetical protein